MPDTKLHIRSADHCRDTKLRIYHVSISRARLLALIDIDGAQALLAVEEFRAECRRNGDSRAWWPGAARDWVQQRDVAYFPTAPCSDLDSEGRCRGHEIIVRAEAATALLSESGLTICSDVVETDIGRYLQALAARALTLEAQRDALLWDAEVVRALRDGALDGFDMGTGTLSDFIVDLDVEVAP